MEYYVVELADVGYVICRQVPGRNPIEFEAVTYAIECRVTTDKVLSDLKRNRARADLSDLTRYLMRPGK